MERTYHSGLFVRELSYLVSRNRTGTSMSDSMASVPTRARSKFHVSTEADAASSSSINLEGFALARRRSCYLWIIAFFISATNSSGVHSLPVKM